MKILGSATLLLLAFAAPSALADSGVYRGDQNLLNNHTAYHGDLLAHSGDRHYRTDKRRHYKKYRNHRKYRRNYYRGHRRHNYDYRLDFHVYPHYYNKRYYRNHKRHYRRDYRRHYRHRDYCHYRGDGFKWLAGAVVASELLHYAFDNPQDEWHYSDHHDYRDDDWQRSDYQTHSPADSDFDHEQHYRHYHAAKYGG